MTAEQLPAPLPPETEPPPRLKGFLQYRFLLVALAFVLFFTLLFGLGWYRKARTAAAPSPEAAPVVAASPAAKKAAPLEPPQVEVKAGPIPAEADPAKAAGSRPATVGAPPHATAAPPPLVPVPSPPPAAAAPVVTGQAFTHALAKIMDDQVNKTLFGWRPNTVIFGKMGLTDNINNLQLGVLDVARRTAIVLNENLTRFAITESYNSQVNEAMNFLMVSPDKYWFPSASGKYREAVQDLESYSDDLRLGRSRFYNRVDHLIVLFNNYKDLLGSCYHNLVKDTEADGSPVSWFKADDYFYFSMGVALSMAEMLEGVKEDFHEQLQKKNTLRLLEDAIHALHAASHLDPWVITDGAKDGILANHRANLSTYIGEAEHLVATMQNVLATN
jgi:hypothetical protein